MHRLCMLAQVVQSGESAVAMALEGSLASMFPDVTSQMLTSGKAEVARGVARTKEPLALFLSPGRIGLPLLAFVV